MTCNEFLTHFMTIAIFYTPGKHIHFKNYDVTIWDTNNCNTYILPNILIGTRNETIQFGHLIENQSLVYLCVYNLTFYLVYFYCMSSSGLSIYIETILQTICFYPK